MANARRKLEIMWVEDQIEDFSPGMEVLKEELRNRGFEVTEFDRWTAITIEDAERMLETFEISAHKPDVILLDLMIPQDPEDLELRRVDIDGGYLIWFEIRKLKKWLSLVDVPILIITARGRPEYRDQVVADEATRWLSKPADPSKVAEKIKELLAPSEAASQLSSE